MVDSTSYYEDLALFPDINSTGDVSTVKNIDAIKQSLKLLLNTKRGSRIFQPNYGCRIESFLFEPFDQTTGTRIGEEIEESFRNYEKRISLITINVKMDWDTTSYIVDVVYKIANTQTVDTLQVKLEKI